MTNTPKILDLTYEAGAILLGERRGDFACGGDHATHRQSLWRGGRRPLCT